MAYNFVEPSGKTQWYSYIWDYFCSRQALGDRDTRRNSATSRDRCNWGAWWSNSAHMVTRALQISPGSKKNWPLEEKASPEPEPEPVPEPPKGPVRPAFPTTINEDNIEEVYRQIREYPLYMQQLGALIGKHNAGRPTRRGQKSISRMTRYRATRGHLTHIWFLVMQAFTDCRSWGGPRLYMYRARYRKIWKYSKSYGRFQRAPEHAPLSSKSYGKEKSWRKSYRCSFWR